MDSHKIRCLVVDDEELAIELLVDNIKEVEFLELVGTCKNAIEANNFLTENQVDLIFLDIQMPGMTGIQFLEGLAIKPLVIFVTAYEQYALEGYQLDVLDYLLKPISFERFLKAVNKTKEAMVYLEAKKHPTSKTNLDYIFIHADYSLIKVNFSDIDFVEGLKDYIKIHLKSQKFPLVCRMTMKGIEEKLPSEYFIRIHKSFIIAINSIESIRNQKVKIGENHIPLSENYSEEFYEKIGFNKS
ncbi:MAG: hypothetical protein RIR51_181 [Bacteroidota bacterium]|jgi:DNA-binding LytR/AlgR family response regulator